MGRIQRWRMPVLAVALSATAAVALFRDEAQVSAATTAVPGAAGPQVTFQPYIQPGDSGPAGSEDQMLVAWQTDETTPSASYRVEFGESTSYGHVAVVKGRIVDNYLAADHQFAALSIPTAYGAHTDYYAVLSHLERDTTYYYRVTGSGLPYGKFESSFRTRRRGSSFSFQVMGDEGFYPNIPGSTNIANFEARVIHTMYHVQDLQFPNQPGQPRFPVPDLALNTGDNVYTVGSEANYRDWWMDVWNSDSDTNDDGAPFIRHIPLYIVVGNHDVGSTGASANLLADNPPTVPGVSGPGIFGGGVSGGDALAHFNNFYYPLNGPLGVDIQSIFNGDTSTPTGMFFTYQGTTYTSPAAIEAYRASTIVDSGQGVKRQIDHMSNYSFDYGNAHFVFLDANPHVFNALLPGGATYQSVPTFPFPFYPSVLRKWLINDLDSSNKPWKFIIFHQPAFSSGNATLRNDQMRRVAKFLEDHGANMVFNGHEHNYQRTRPLRMLPGFDQAPTTAGSPVVAIDQNFDGQSQTVPDGVFYLVEGAGGNRDFDDNLTGPRGGGAAIDQDDAATGSTTVAPGQSFPNGPASWLDTNLTNTAMTPFLSNAGSGPKITVKFKSKLFSFADILVNGNSLTLYQISEPLSTTNSGQFGTDVNGNLANDPLPVTQIDPTTGNNVVLAGQGTSTLLDKFTITKPDVSAAIKIDVSASPISALGSFTLTLKVTNNGGISLNGTQLVLTLPEGFSLGDSPSDTLTSSGPNVILTLGRLAAGANVQTLVSINLAGGLHGNPSIELSLRSSTTQSVEGPVVRIKHSDQP